MKKYYLIGALVVAAIAACTVHAEQRPQGLVIDKQGVFSSGGRITNPIPGEYDPTTNWLDSERKGTTTHVDHANTFYQIPAGGSGTPIVFLHGYGQTRTGWQSTPDGREGWSDLFLKKGYSVFLVDQPRRGAAGATEEIVTDPGDVVIDPCAGSGSTLRAARELGRPSYGFEVSRDFYKKATEQMLGEETA